MKITIEIRTENAAFENCPGELNRILLALPEKVERLYPQYTGSLLHFPESSEALFDINGNKVGFIRISN